MISDREINRIADLVAEKIVAESGCIDRWLTIRQAQRYAKMSRNTLMQCIQNGEIEAKKRKVGGWIIDRESIDDYNRNDFNILLLKNIEKRIRP